MHFPVLCTIRLFPAITKTKNAVSLFAEKIKTITEVLISYVLLKKRNLQLQLISLLKKQIEHILKKGGKSIAGTYLER